MKYGVLDTEMEEIPAVSEGGTKRKSDFVEAADVDVWVTTETVDDDCVMHWNIADIRSVSSDSIKSPLFKAGRKFQHIWQVEVKPKVESEGETYLGVKVKLVAFANESELDVGRQLKVLVDMYILDNDQELCYGVEGYDFMGKGDSLGWNEFLKVEHLNYVLQRNGDLRLLVGITIKMDTHIQGHEVTEVTCEPPPKKSCRCDCKKIRQRIHEVNDLENKEPRSGVIFKSDKEVNDLENPKSKESAEILGSRSGVTYPFKIDDDLSDFEIIAAAKTSRDFSVFKVHKSVLAENSPFFHCLFNTETNGDFCRDWVNFDLTSEVAEVILTFMYTGRVRSDDLEGHASDLMQFADLFEMEELKGLAEGVLVKTICMENVVTLWINSRIFEAKSLEAETLKFLQRHPEIKNHESFQRLQVIENLVSKIWPPLVEGEGHKSANDQK